MSDDIVERLTESQAMRERGKYLSLYDSEELQKDALAAITSLRAEVARFSEKVVRYEKWFADNATNLAVHKIGGYAFYEHEPLPEPQ